MSSVDKSGHRSILRSTSIIGGATGFGLAVGLVKMKVIAALMGPVGVGLLGMFSSLMGMGTSVIGMATDTSSVRLMSSAVDDTRRAWNARWAVWTFALPLAVIAIGLFWVFQQDIARLALGNRDYAHGVRWIGLGVAASIIAGVQVAIVQSYRRMGDLARIRMISAGIAASTSVAAIYAFGNAALIVAVVLTPVATLIVAAAMRHRLPRLSRGAVPGLRVLRPDWRLVATLGMAVTITALMGSGSQTMVRAVLAQQLGLASTGLFQASFAVSSLNLGLVLGAMIADYYPRLSAVADDPAAMQQVVNQQIHVGLILAAPALLGIAAVAPILLHILYTKDFAGAALLLRIQLAADALRVVGWALGFVLLARRVTIGYFFVEFTLSSIFAGITWAFAGRFGVATAGAGYFLGYAASLAISLALSLREGVSLDGGNARAICALVASLIGIAVLSIVAPLAALLGGLLIAVVASLISMREVVRIGFPPLPASIQHWLGERLGWARDD